MYGGFSTPVRVMRSDDHGITWTDLPFPIGFVDAAVYLAIDPYNHDVVYAGVLDYGFFKTTDGGQTWRDINEGIPAGTRRMKTIALNPRNPENIFVGMEDNTPFDGESDLIYVTEDGGAHWSRFSSGLPHAGHIRGISIDPRQLKIVAGVNGAEGSGIYQLSPLTGVSTQQMDRFPESLFQNSPNPFNAETTIRFTLAERSNVRLSVFSVPGELVEVLVDGEMEKGNHVVRFDARGLATGVYLYALETGSSRTIRRMILLR
jgi:hypothetical protein